MCGWYWLFDSSVLHFFDFGLWGIHNSLLPKYRGGAPLVWSIINGDHLVGSTIFKISEGLDDGEILHQVKIKNEFNDDISILLSKIEDKLINDLPHYWRLLLSNTAVLKKQDAYKATYCGQRTNLDGLINWSQGAEDVHNFIRAQVSPYPCAFSYLFEEKIYFLQSKVIKITYYGTPGQILKINNSSVYISCGNETVIEVFKIISCGTVYAANQILNSLRFRLINQSTPLLN